MKQRSQRDLDAVFLNAYSPVLAYAARRVGDERAQDVVAETFLIAWRRRADIPRDPVPWLYGVARRVIANQARGDRRRLALVRRLAERGAPVPTELPLSDGTLRRALESLPACEREAVLLVAWEGLEPARAARAAGCSAVAFRVRLHRARRHLRTAFAVDDGAKGSKRFRLEDE